MIGMRGHANIIPFGQNTPCIGIGEHNKVRWFLEEVGMLDSYVPLGADKQFGKDRLSDVIDKHISNLNTYKLDMCLMKNKLINTKDIFVDKLVSVL